MTSKRKKSDLNYIFVKRRKEMWHVKSRNCPLVPSQSQFFSHHYLLALTGTSLVPSCDMFLIRFLLTSVSRKRRRALFFLMFFRRTDTATLSTMITTMKRPPITPAAISGVLGTERVDNWVRGRRGRSSNIFIRGRRRLTGGDVNWLV